MPKFAVQATRKGLDGRKEVSTTLVEAVDADACVSGLLSRTYQRPDIDLIGYSVFETRLVRKVKVECSQTHEVLKGDELHKKS